MLERWAGLGEALLRIDARDPQAARRAALAAAGGLIYHSARWLVEPEYMLALERARVDQERESQGAFCAARFPAAAAAGGAWEVRVACLMARGPGGVEARQHWVKGVIWRSERPHGSALRHGADDPELWDRIDAAHAERGALAGALLRPARGRAERAGALRV